MLLASISEQNNALRHTVVPSAWSVAHAGAPCYHTNMNRAALRSRPSYAKGVLKTVVYGLVGWGLCGATMGVAMALTTLPRALVIHALAAPLIFAALSVFYFRRPGSWSPLGTAATFLGVVVAMDVFVVALLIQKSFEMFGNAVGTWLPFALIFVSTWCTGTALRRAAPGTGP